MKVALNPNVSFRANLIDEAKNGSNQSGTIQVPIGAPLNNRPVSQEEMDKNLAEFNQALKDGQKVETVITSKHWDKVYMPGENAVHAKMPGAYDGLEYTIYSNGKVVTETGWGQPKVERESDEKLAKYVEQMKNGTITEAATFSKEANSLKDIQNENKLVEIKETLKSRKWKKTYLPESDVIWVEQKRVKDGVAYCIEKDGTVKETYPSEGKSEVIIESNKDMSKIFNDIKADETKPKKSFGYKVRDAIGDTWKFFSATGTMTMATAKGIVYGAGAGIGVVMGAALLKLIEHPKNYKEIFTNPLKAAGKTGKILAGTAAALLLVSNIVAGKLQANENTAVIEHKMNTDHRYD